MCMWGTICLLVVWLYRLERKAEDIARPTFDLGPDALFLLFSLKWIYITFVKYLVKSM